MDRLQVVLAIFAILTTWLYLFWVKEPLVEYEQILTPGGNDDWWNDPDRVAAFADRTPDLPIDEIFTSRNVEFIAFTTVMMLDWDLGEGPGKITEEDWDEIFNRIVKSHHTFRVYRTPGGYRAFVLDLWWANGPFEMAFDMMEEMNCDPAYQVMTRETGAWSVRVSPKVGREGDYVAHYIGTYGGMGDIRGFHDRCPKEWQMRIMDYIRQHDQHIAQYRPDQDLPNSSGTLVESLVNAWWQEPWEPVHRAALHDLYEDWMDEIRPDHVVESDWETKTPTEPVVVTIGGSDQDDLPY